MPPTKSTDKPADADAPAEDKDAAKGTESEAPERGTHSLLLGNGEVVQLKAGSSPAATEHYGKDGQLWPVVNVVANPPAEEEV